MLGCLGPNKDLPNLYLGPPVALQPLPMPRPWLAGGGNEGLSERGTGGDGLLEKGERVDVRDDAGGGGEDGI